MPEHAHLLPDESSPPDPSPAHLFGESSIRRSLVRISTEQQDLLSREESWAHHLRSRPKGFMNVPPEVLKTVKDHHARQQRTLQSGGLPSPKGKSPSNEDQPQPEAPASDQNSNLSSNDPEDDSSEGTPVSNWSESQKSAPPPENPMPDEPGSEGPPQPFETQIPEESPLQATIPPSKRPAFRDFPPSSSPDQDDELEFKPVSALASTTMPVNKSALATTFNTTPPSAQIVPCTFEQSRSMDPPTVQKDSRCRPDPRQPIYKPVPALYRPSKPATSGKNPLHVELGSSLSTTNTSSPIIPATNQVESVARRVPAWLGHQASSRQPQTDSKTSDIPQKQVPRPLSPVYKPPSPGLQTSAPVLPAVDKDPSPARDLPIPPPPSPFTLYSITYPTYKGNIRDFITSCTYIQSQHHRIRSCLYDDFIRAWVEGYLPYINECDAAGREVKAMNAIEWFNSIEEDPLFNAGIIRKSNLEAILKFYPDEWQNARKVIGVSPSQSPKTGVRRASESKILSHVGGPPSAASISPPRAVRAPREIAGLDESLPSKKQPPLIEAPRGMTAPLQSTKKPDEDQRDKPLPAMGLAHSFSDVLSNKRKASLELNGDNKRAMGNHRMRSDSVSAGSIHSDRSKSTNAGSVATASTAQRRKKYADDPEKRSRQFAKFLKKRKWETESIASSAPPPTSAQRE
ncbi:hypothetical protein F4780DRAFT_727646 [Xylariomycetidae sp. FL0641]|nr:hypothetical protein F4780DRAFT_727646 [Xylariomycetidae sp. FL0641]